jgi:hypothetical protein
MFVYPQIVQRSGLCAEGPLDLPPGQVLVVQNSVGGVTAFPTKVIFLELVCIKAGAPLNNFLYPRGAFLHHDPDNILVAEAGARVQGIGNMFLESIGTVVPYGGDSPLGVTGVTLPFVDLGEHVDLQVGAKDGELNCRAEAGNAGADYENISTKHGMDFKINICV